MIAWFKRKRPRHSTTTAPTLSVPDLLAARFAGLTPEQWSDLPSLAQVDHRENYERCWGLGK